MSLPSTSHLASIIGPAVKSLGYEFIACELIPQGKRVTLRIYIDSEEGITIRDCEIVGRQMGAVLDVECPIIMHYSLEISSPGESRLLVTAEHYQRFIGHYIKIKLRDSRNGRRNYTGLLHSISEGNLRIIVDGDTYILPISDIERANLVPDV
jgi:ribosome maturation factor RimP